MQLRTPECHASLRIALEEDSLDNSCWLKSDTAVELSGMPGGVEVNMPLFAYNGYL